ncbi:MAG TPA: DUF6298 domain-containing protein, partial [Gemmatimonadaceae bacterium]
GRAAWIGFGAVACLGAGAIGATRYYQGGLPRYQRPVVPPRPPGRAPRGPATGPLTRHVSNPRYFADATGRPVVLTGDHTWSNFQDNGFGDPPPRFDYDAYLDFLAAHNVNFIRLWRWENTRWAPWVRTNDYYFEPGPYRRTGPGTALDGKPRFNLDSLDPAFFARMRERVEQAGQRGVYVSIMLFNAWSIDNTHSQLNRGNPWRGHPFNRANNVNGVDGDTNHDDQGSETHEAVGTKVTAYQDAYVRRVIDAVNDLDNVLYEISNESYSPSREWQYHMINLIHDYEKGRAKHHPVGMSQYQWPGRDADLFDSPADWVSPWEELPAYPYRDNPRVSDGKKVVIVDTDHLWGIGGTRAWAWKNFMRGNNPSFMDGYDGASEGGGAPIPWDVRLMGWKDIVNDVLGRTPRDTGWRPNSPQWVSLRANLGYIEDFAQRVNLAAMEPRSALSSTGYCLAYARTSDAEYLIYVPDGSKPVEVDLSGFRGQLSVEWFDPQTANTAKAEPVAGGAKRRFESPYRGDAVLYLRSQDTAEVPGTRTRSRG